MVVNTPESRLTGPLVIHPFAGVEVDNALVILLRQETTVAQLVDIDVSIGLSLGVIEILVGIQSSCFRIENVAAEEVGFVDNKTVNKHHLCRIGCHAVHLFLMHQFFCSWCRLAYVPFLPLGISRRGQHKQCNKKHDAYSHIYDYLVLFCANIRNFT